MTNELKPWIPGELPPPRKKPSLTEEITAIIQANWHDEGFRALAASTDKDDAVEGSVNTDKVLFAERIRSLSTPGSSVANATVDDIKHVAHHAQKRLGVDRKSIAERKQMYLEIDAPPATPETNEPQTN